MDVSISTADFGHICRICLKEDGTLRSIVEEDVKLIADTLNINIVDEDQLPTNICQPCHKNLQHIQDIQRSARSCNNYLLLLSQENKNKSKEDEEKEQYNTEHNEDKEQVITEDLVKNTDDDCYMLIVEDGDVNTIQKFYKYDVEHDSEETDDCDENSSCDRPTSFHQNKKLKETTDGLGEGKKETPLIRNLKTTFFCDICGKGCGGKANLNRHYTTHTKGTAKSALLECGMCNKVFNSKVSLKEHLIQHNNEKLASSNADIYVCGVCGKQFQSKAQCLAHKNNHQSYPKKCKKCPELLYSDASYKEHLKTHVQGYSCENCDLSFPSVKQLNTHMNYHMADGAVTFDCDVCNISFVTEARLAQHRKRTGHDLVQIACDRCQKWFNDVISYATHVRNHKHTTLASVCGLCGGEFNNNMELMNHVEVHCDDLHCGLCGILFTNLNDLLDHKAVHDYTCDKCGKEMKSEVDLEEHLATHSLYNCQPCKIEFNSEVECTRHFLDNH